MGGWRCGYLRRSREGSDYTTINLYFVSHVFQSTLPRRERRPANGRFRCAPPHFNPRSREGSDSTLCGGNLFLICISIHAPAKGATSRPTSISSTAAFQSTLPRRERPPTQATPTARHDTFQSTLPRRERPTIKRSAKLNQSFQSTLPRRERHVVRAVSVKYDSVFQSTLPRRERRVCACGVRVLAFYFNPRSREGSDFLLLLSPLRQRVFQSTLPRRERRCCSYRRF